jgi:hypothetical protein
MLKGAIKNKDGEFILPEHTILSSIKGDAKNKKFGYTSVYEEMQSTEMQDAIVAMEEHGIVLTGAIFNGNYAVPHKAFAKSEGLEYKSIERNWYSLLGFPALEYSISPVGTSILYGLANYLLLSYPDYTDTETFIDEVKEGTVFSNSFSDAFTFNHLGFSYLKNMLEGVTTHNCLVIRPKDTQMFVIEMTEYLLGTVDTPPKEPKFDLVMGKTIIKAIDAGIFDCDNIVMVSQDLLVLAFRPDEIINNDYLEAEFMYLLETDASDAQEPKSQRILSSKMNGSSLFTK